MGCPLSVDRPHRPRLVLDLNPSSAQILLRMDPATEHVTLTWPRSVIPDVASLSSRLLDRMHELLERGTDDHLSAIERDELDTLVRMAQFGQVLSMALQARTRP